MRSIETHSWPALLKQSRTAPSAARSRSASAQHEHRVLAAELERAADQPAGAALGHLAADRRRAGEADVVAAVDDRPADHRTVADHDLPQVRRQPGLDGERPDPQGGQRGLGVRLVHDGVARDERRDRVGDRQGERVVPGRHDADHALRVVQLVRGRQHRHDAAVPHRREVAAARRARSGGPSARRRRPPRRRAGGPCRSRAARGRGPRPAGRAPGRAAAGRPRSRSASGRRRPRAAGRPAPRRTP